MFIEESLKTQIVSSADVMVCGGGIAGIAAALAAARQKKKVILLEREFLLGGLATSGLITMYLPICDGCGNQVSFGIAEELLRLPLKINSEDTDYPANWIDSSEKEGRTEKDKRFELSFNPSFYAILAEKLLLDAGVRILYGTYAVAVKKENNKITEVIVENKSGRTAISVGSVVDATGDCDIAQFADAPTEKFKQGNILAAWYYFLENGKNKLNALGFCDIPDDQKSETNKVDLLIQRRFSGLDGEELSEMVINSHSCLFNDIMKKRNKGKKIIPTSIATIPQIRMTRKIVGEYVLDDREMHKYFEDSVGMVSDWRKRGPVYEVPFGTLYSGKVKNLICAGRCTSVTDSMWDIMRVIPCCAVTGQAAGTAAALSSDFSKLDVKLLQECLLKDEVILHEKDLKK